MAPWCIDSPALRPLRTALALALAVAACTSSPPACEVSLDGVWRTGATVDGEAIGYHFLDRRGAIEGYPTFRDVPATCRPVCGPRRR